MRPMILAIFGLLLTAWLITEIGGEKKAMAEKGKIRLLVVTGGHEFERESFFSLFKGYPDITYQEAEHPKAHDLFKSYAAQRYDVIVLYDMWQDISDEAKANFVDLLKRGKGLVALHHCLASYQAWDEYAKIIGGKFHLQKWIESGVEKPPSTAMHGVKFTVRIADPKHPVTRGLKDFEILDETYGNFEVSSKVKVLLTTDEPTSNKIIAWAHTYGKSRVVYIQLGHDHTAYENPNYRRLVVQAIRWTAEKQK